MWLFSHCFSHSFEKGLWSLNVCISLIWVTKDAGVCRLVPLHLPHAKLVLPNITGKYKEKYLNSEIITLG